LFRTIKTIGINRSTEYPQELKNLKKECILDMLDSINDNNYYQIIHIVTMYYVFIEPNAFKNVYVEKTDSTISAKISYGLSNKNFKIAEKCRRYLEITKQLLWILQRDSLTRKSLREYVINQNGNVDNDIVSYISSTKDTFAFWIIYKNIKEKRKDDGSAMSFMLYNGMKYFKYYTLFLENAEHLVNIGWAPMVIDALCTTLPKDYDFNAAKKTYSKIVLNEHVMRSLSSADGENVSVSVFNYDFSHGIETFYPQLAKMDEYINSCMKPPKYCEFDKRLYNLLVKTIKSEYKDLK
jgi:hypothetical protein